MSGIRRAKGLLLFVIRLGSAAVHFAQGDLDPDSDAHLCSVNDFAFLPIDIASLLGLPSLASEECGIQELSIAAAQLSCFSLTDELSCETLSAILLREAVLLLMLPSDSNANGSSLI
jgi:hypothetical protein